MENKESNVSNSSSVTNESSGETMSMSVSLSETTSDLNLEMVNDRNTTSAMAFSEHVDISETSSLSSLSAKSVEDDCEQCEHNLSSNQDVDSMSRFEFLKYQKKLLNLEREAELERESMKVSDNLFVLFLVH